jgi:hypothetical protein
MIFGVHTYGRVEQVPGVFYRATPFFHINFLPLLPIGGVIVVDRKALRTAEHLHVKTPFSILSFAMAYVRAALWFGVVVTVIATFVLLTDPVLRNRDPGESILGIGSAAGCGFLLWLSHRLTRASHRRARAIADDIGLDRLVVDAYFIDNTDRSVERELPANVATSPKSAGQDDVFRLE